MVFNVNDSDKRNIKTAYPREIIKKEHVWIPLSDGAKLAATIWLPKDAEEKPVPVILEYLPYRKDDFTAIRDSIRHPYFAGHGYASIRVDIRGTGNSDGILLDEYLKQEHDDALEIFDWVCKQPWSTGSIGMIGKSWGGFNGLQIAARKHPALKTIITLCSTDDRYADDVHYRGGNILASDMLWWASTMFAYSARPQDPEVVGEGWKENWLQRLNTTPYVNEWMSHQRRNDYWKHGSVCEDYSAIQIPVFAVSGWQDGYTDAVFRMIENLPYAKGLIGPWAHEFPEVATPEPTIGFLQECLRWWDQWLKGVDTGMKDEPKLRSYIQDSALPQVNYDERPGKWVVDTSWPSTQVNEEKFWLNKSGTMTQEPCATKKVLIPSVQEHGYYAGVYCPFGEAGDLPSDQRLENGKSVVFTSEPFDADVDLLGHPIFHMAFTSDQANALVAVRLSDKAPTGESTLISWGMLNLNHLESHEKPTLLEKGKVYHASIKLDSIGQNLPAGHRLEVALSPTYWPQAWPSPKPVTLEVITGEDTLLSLPVRTPDPKLDSTIHFKPSETAPVIEREILREESRTREVTHSTITDKWKLEDFSDEGERRLIHNGLKHGSINKNTYSIKSGDPLSAHIRCEWEMTLGREDWDIKMYTESEMTSDETTFYLTNKLTAYYNKEEFFTRTWKKQIPRDFQ
ncbi:CocE/NonD family hydrolase [Virgibacillus sp. SK37]|uniref:CocE/NonD family hydrolase n=1 Tax=Virgibacillus sp. SK37 TaxID=403957 RepID=UPI0004D12D43|nr:CocE/NonD family hydrolase [Virgibacillus sp. SK37]AIF44459.1 peptidase S15 [Virgibacillus sp. SK37]